MSSKLSIIRFLYVAFLISSAAPYCYGQFFDANWMSKSNYSDIGVAVRYNPADDSLYTEPFTDVFNFFENQMISDTLGNPLFFSTGLQLWLDFDTIMPGGDSMFVNIGVAEEFYAETDWFPYAPLDWELSNTLPLQNGDYLYIHYSFRDRWSSGFDIMVTDTAGWDLIHYCENAYSSYIRTADDSLYVEPSTKMELMLEGRFVATSNTFIKHANGADWWLYLPEVDSDSVRVVLIDGVNGQVLQEDQYIFSLSNQLATNSSYMFPSPDGTSMARFVYRSGGHPTEDFFQNLLEFYDIDRCTGIPTLRSYQWMDNFPSHGVTADLEWSPSGRYVYIAYNKIIMQLDMLDAQYWDHRDTVATWVEGDPDSPLVIFFSDLQTLPNDEILVSGFGSSPFMHLIESPDLPGDFCDFRYKYYESPCLDPACEERTWFEGIPRWVPFRMGPLDGAPCVTSTSQPVRRYVEQLEIYPSPAIDRVYLRGSHDLVGETMVIHDQVGRLVATVVYDDGVDVSGLSPGTYFVHGADIGVAGRFIKI